MTQNKATPKEWNPHPKLVKILNDRTHYTCPHCERQYDDDMCNSCLAKKIIKEILKPALIEFSKDNDALKQAGEEV